jgi:hypothetical protein
MTKDELNSPSIDNILLIEHYHVPEGTREISKE